MEEENSEDVLTTTNAEQKKLLQEYEKLRKEAEMNKDFEKDMKKVFEDFKQKGFFDENGNFNEARAFRRGNVAEIKKFSRENPDLIVEVADNGAQRVYARKTRYDDPGESYVVKDKLVPVGANKYKLETADDDERVLGIPYAQAMAGDRVYIINGKVFTGWALYFSLS